VDREQVDRWLQRYVDAWKSYDRDRIGDLFSETAEYRYHPYDEPVGGRAAIVESWFENADEPGTFDAAYEAIAVDGDVAVAVGTSTYRNVDGSLDAIYDNIFVMRFEDEGRCSKFTEWYVKRPGQSE
jgi:ketosteroid isomerase-like protein